MISLNKCTGGCNALAPKICVSKETKEISVKAFNMITNKNEAKVMTEHISRNCKCKSNSAACNSKQKWNNVNVNVNMNVKKSVSVSVKIIVSAKKIIVGILAHVFVRIVSI